MPAGVPTGTGQAPESVNGHQSAEANRKVPEKSSEGLGRTYASSWAETTVQPALQPQPSTRELDHFKTASQENCYMKLIVTVLFFAGLQLSGQDMQSCPMHKEHMKEASQHQEQVEKHGDEAMGFPHDKTTHHFRLYSDGGAIEVTANDQKDSSNIDAIRSHLAHIVTIFSNGDFSLPMFIHDQVPPGVPVMKEKRSEIAYSFETLSAGGRVRIKTTNPRALEAIHSFLRFQIQDHRTGDSNDVSQP